MSEAVEAVIDRRDPPPEPRFGSDFRRSKESNEAHATIRSSESLMLKVWKKRGGQ